MFPIKNYWTTRRTYEHGSKTFYNDFHLGEDLIVPVGTKIYAISDGYMWYAWGKQGGNTCYFKDDKGNVLRFLHNSHVYPKGDYKEGEVIALSGNTGLSKGPHIHHDISKKKLELNNIKNFIDPKDYYMKQVKCLIVSDTKLELSVISDWYRKRGLDLIMDEKITKMKAKWNLSDSVGVRLVDMNHWGRTVAPLASGYDIVLQVCRPEDYKRDNTNGYANYVQSLGLWNGFVLLHQGARQEISNLPNNTLGTIIHELSHLLHNACGQSDMTHKLDNKGQLDKMKLRLDYFQGWELKGATRLFKYSEEERGTIMRIITDTMANRFKEKIGYFKRAGKYTTNITSYELK